MLFRLLLLIFPVFHAHGDNFVNFRKHFQSENYTESLASINDKAPKGHKYFAYGIVHYKMGAFEKAIEDLDIAYGEKINLDDLIFFYEGVSYFKLNKLKTAEHLLKKVVKFKPESFKKNEAKFYLAQIMLKQNRNKEAEKFLAELENPMKKQKKYYPDILLGLSEIYLKRNKNYSSCRRAKKLFINYPNHPITKDWEVDNFNVNGNHLSCQTSLRDKIKWVKRLQYEGKTEKAVLEIENLKNKVPELEHDILLATHLTQVGDVEKAHEILTKHYPETTEYTFLNLLANINSKLGLHDGSTKMYDYIIELGFSKRRKDRAFFNSAFESFQNEKYDLAAKKFSKLFFATNNSRILRDASWYKAWAKYLNEDYLGAISGFNKIIDGKLDYNKRRAQYFLALSYLKTNEPRKAKQILEEISSDKYDYYSLIASNRLDKLKKIRFTSWFAKSKRALDNSESGSENQIVNNNELFSEKFKNRFERANLLEKMGFYDHAKEELYFVEKKTKNKLDLRLLMAHYNKINAYSRASYVGEVFLSEELGNKPASQNRVIWKNTYPRAYEKHVLQFSEEYNVERELIWAIMKAESNYRKGAISPVGALGLMQIMPYTGEKVALILDETSFDASMLENPKLNIKFGSRYLSRLLNQFNKNIVLAAAAYNAGPHRVNRWVGKLNDLSVDEFIDHIPFRQTRIYVKKVIKHYHIYKTLYSDDLNKKNYLVFLSKPLKAKKKSKFIHKEDWSDVAAYRKKIGVKRASPSFEFYSKK